MTNIAIVVLDTLRKDAFDAHFDWLPGVTFENAWSPSHWTVPVHASLFAGGYPSELGVHVENQYLNCPKPVLAELLNDAGYVTRAFSSNVNVSKPFNFHRGFDEFEGSWRLEGLGGDVFDWQNFIAETRSTGPLRYLRAVRQCVREDCDTWLSLKRGAVLKLRSLGLFDNQDDGAREALEYVRTSTFDEREFLFVNLMEAHGPYAPPEEYVSVGTREEARERTRYNGLVATATDGPDDDAEFLRQAYDDSVRYLSDVYREIFGELSESFDVVITLSDHGELFGEHGAWQHAYGVYPELVHVPLCISGDRVPHTVSESVVSLLDVHRTVLDLAGVEADSAGEPLLESGDGEFALARPGRPCAAEYHGITPLNRSSVVQAGLDPDPYERELLGAVSPDFSYSYEMHSGIATTGRNKDADAAAEHFAVHREQIDRRQVETPTGVSSSVRRRLEDLGYA